MSEEELEKEVTEYLNTQTLPKIDNIVYRVIKNLIFGFAEPREKRIEELKKQLDLKEKALSKAKKETKRIADRVNKDRRRLIRRKTELEAQIEKMECCYNCSKWYDGECEESPKSKTFFCADFKCDKWELAND